MNFRNTTERYGALSIGMHWLMLLLLVAVYAAINLHDVAPKGSALRADLKTWHYMLGLCVFVLVAVRLLIRAFSGAVPRIAPDLPRWQEALAKAMHAALYVFMVAMPLLGWLAVSAKGDPVPFFGLELPTLLGPSKALAHDLKEIHETIGTVGYDLIGVHAAAALFHHYVLRDTTLVRMLPTRG
jgi:cytochrome b561